MRPTRHRQVRRATVALVAAGFALGIASVPALAKMFLEARFDAPISFQSPPGEVLLVGVTVTVPEGLEDHVAGNAPVWLVLHGPRGDSTEAQGAMGTGPGHYAFRIEVPAGGPRTLEVVVRDGPDVPIFLMADPFTFRPIGPDTAQLAPPLAPIGPREPAAPPAAAPVAPVAAAPAPPVAAAPVVASAAPALLAVALVALGLLVAAIGLLVTRSARRAPPADRPRQAPGA